LSVDPSSSRLMAYVRGLPRGCKLCMRGSKLVIFVTGVCPENCFYCPVSPRRRGRRVVYVDEEEAKSFRDVVEEADAIGAEGASFTGGEPLTAPRRVEALARLLKDLYGPGFHIHLYTGGSMLTRHALKWLSGIVDEVRVHPRTPDQWRHVLRLAEFRRIEGLDVSLGVEVPVIPGDGGRLVGWIRELDKAGVDFVNLNEFEWAPHTLRALLERGFTPGEGSSVKGSWEEALRIMEEAGRITERIMIHYCSSRYKDVVQLRMRNYRKALRTSRGYELVKSEGVVVFLEPGIPASSLADYCSNGLTRCWPLLDIDGCVVEAYPSRSREPIVSRRCRGSG